MIFQLHFNFFAHFIFTRRRSGRRVRREVDKLVFCSKQKWSQSDTLHRYTTLQSGYTQEPNRCEWKRWRATGHNATSSYARQSSNCWPTDELQLRVDRLQPRLCQDIVVDVCRCRCRCCLVVANAITFCVCRHRANKGRWFPYRHDDSTHFGNNRGRPSVSPVHWILLPLYNY